MDLLNADTVTTVFELIAYDCCFPDVELIELIPFESRKGFLEMIYGFKARIVEQR
jgi:hypothetical protein